MLPDHHTQEKLERASGGGGIRTKLMSKPKLSLEKSQTIKERHNQDKLNWKGET
jgi:hypothetical protein